MRFFQLKPRHQASSRRQSTSIPLTSITIGGTTTSGTGTISHTIDGATATTRTGLLQLPAELRNIIYELVLLADGEFITTSYAVLPPSEHPADLGPRKCRSGVVPALLQTSQQMRTEAMPMYFASCLFFLALHDRNGEFAKTLTWLQSTDPGALSHIRSLMILGYVEGVESFDLIECPCIFGVSLMMPGSYAQLRDWIESSGTNKINKRVCLATALLDDFIQLRTTEVWTQVEHKARLIAVVKEVHDVLQMSYREHIESWIGNMMVKVQESRVAVIMTNTRTQRIIYMVVSALAIAAVCLIAGLLIPSQKKPPHTTTSELIGSTPSMAEGGLQVR
ncbi:hypothetical protein LTR56_017522 [Elasticomyces elasticus]|nr:hypothetical protein LTR56_017522 [Elasticomyces elasticus]KAK3665078.1 hypothetical protein LTR22_004134 [Elasticomyces elasticus]KAK4931548.1 hypothetical protein LTR49_001936 [Elasticomyces elasticus]KAK5766708.1 hypothetical protein LTS12_003057 [Elasticomyces elasticus]